MSYQLLLVVFTKLVLKSNSPNIAYIFGGEGPYGVQGLREIIDMSAKKALNQVPLGISDSVHVP